MVSRKRTVLNLPPAETGFALAFNWGHERQGIEVLVVCMNAEEDYDHFCVVSCTSTQGDENEVHSENTTQ